MSCFPFSTKLVLGDVECPLSHLAIAALSYVWPSEQITGSFITSLVIGLHGIKRAKG